MNLWKTILCGTALSAIALAAVPAAAQVTIGGEDIVTTPDGVVAVVNNGGDIDANGASVLDSAGTLTLDDSVAVTGTLTTTGAIFANGGIATQGANINTGGGLLNLANGDIVNGDSITANSASLTTLAVTGVQTNTGAIFANGGIATQGANINTGGGLLNLASGDIVNGGTFTLTTLNATTTNTGTLAVTSNATIGQDLAVTQNLTVGGNATVTGNISTTAGDIVTVTGDVVAGGIRLDSATGRINGVAAGSATTDAVNVGQLNTAVGTLNARIDTVNARVDVLTGRIAGFEDDVNRAFQGVAMGFAMNAAPLNLDNGEGGISAGAGVFEGEYAGAIRAQFVTESGFGVGANVGFSSDSVGGGVGASIKF